MLLSVLMPVYNEMQTIDEIIEKVQQTPFEKEIIIVDDCSTDGTREHLQTYAAVENIKVVYQPENRGKGAAVRTAIAHIGGDVAIIQDADLEYDPGEYGLLLEPILLGKADVVYGSRFIGAQPHRVLYYWHSVGNKTLTMLSNMFTNLNLTDMECCYKVFRKEVLDSISLEQERFGIEPEITAKIARGKWRIYEVSVSYFGRTYDEGKKINWKDGVQAIYCILKYGLFK
jgi:glycosyltransferase involved in cell wall biosynthesis